MKSEKIFAIADNVITPLGFTTADNFESISAGNSAIQLHNKPEIYPDKIYASYIGDEEIETLAQGEFEEFTKLEKLLILSVEQALSKVDIEPSSPELLFVFSTTKGNIDLLDNIYQDQRLFLWHTAKTIANYFGNVNTPVVVSNACVSGVSAICTAADLLSFGHFKHAIVFGGDLLSRFVVSGFMSLKAFSPCPCTPYSENRLGVNLGEGAATVILSKELPSDIFVAGYGLKNDANHISGPSRNGEGLILAVNEALSNAGIAAQQIDHISAHGTGTEFNDEMEAQAFNALNLADVPMNSVKGSIGHTLGASGLIECALTLESMRSNKVLPTVGFTKSGLTKPLAITRQSIDKELSICLKTASGFGGANAAIIFRKNEKL